MKTEFIIWKGGWETFNTAKSSDIDRETDYTVKMGCKDTEVPRNEEKDEGAS